MLWPVLLLTSGCSAGWCRGPRRVGRLSDFIVRTQRFFEPQLIDRLVVSRRRARRWCCRGRWCPTSAPVGSVLAATGNELTGFETASLTQALAHDEILLRRDVPDTQIVDVAGQRLARVADVLCARTRGVRLEILGVEVGIPAACALVGFGAGWVWAGSFRQSVTTSSRGRIFI